MGSCETSVRKRPRPHGAADDQAALVHQPPSHAARDRRGDLGEFHIELRRLDGGGGQPDGTGLGFRASAWFFLSNLGGNGGRSELVRASNSLLARASWTMARSSWAAAWSRRASNGQTDLAFLYFRAVLEVHLLEMTSDLTTRFTVFTASSRPVYSSHSITFCFAG